MNQKKRIGTIVLLFITTIFYGCKQNNPITEFSTENWYEVEWKQRYHMLDDLFEEVDLVGMSATQIEQLLGKCSVRHEAYWSDEGTVDYHWGYVVRYDWWYGDEYLFIGFKDDIVVSFDLVYGSDI